MYGLSYQCSPFCYNSLSSVKRKGNNNRMDEIFVLLEEESTKGINYSGVDYTSEDDEFEDF